MAKSTKMRRWTVSCEGHPTMSVAADSPEGAILEAARLWGAKWTSIAAWCDVTKGEALYECFCTRCRNNFYAVSQLEKTCPKCQVILAEAAKARARDNRSRKPRYKNRPTKSQAVQAWRAKRGLA